MIALDAPDRGFLVCAPRSLWIRARYRDRLPVPLARVATTQIGWYLDFLKRHRFNAIRLLFNHQSVLRSGETSERVSSDDVLHDAQLAGMTYLEMFAEIANQAASRGIVILIACHRLNPTASQHSTTHPATRSPRTHVHVLLYSPLPSHDSLP